MSTHSVADARNQVSALIDRALAGEGVVITRHGRPVVELRPFSTTSHDVGNAAVFVRRLDLTLRTPDALKIAIAKRVGAILITWDAKMAFCGRALGLSVAPDHPDAH